VAISVLCPCCQLRVAEHLTRDVTGRNVCEACHSAEHSTMQGRDNLHGWLWTQHTKLLVQSEMRAVAKANESAAAARRRAGAEVASVMKALRDLNSQLEKRCTDLENENVRLVEQAAMDYADGMSETLKQHVESTALAHAKNEKDRAYSRENELLAILLIDIAPKHLGKQGPLSRCSCGAMTADCAEWQAIEPVRAQLLVWEKQQLKRMTEGKPFGLPRRHPEVRKVHANTPRWEFRGLPERVASLDRDLLRIERRAV
jgi:hypothetical protein